MRISDWSSDVCSSDLMPLARIVAHEADGLDPLGAQLRDDAKRVDRAFCRLATCHRNSIIIEDLESDIGARGHRGADRQQSAMLIGAVAKILEDMRSEEHTSELQSLMRISYAVFCLKKKKK